MNYDDEDVVSIGYSDITDYETNDDAEIITVSYSDIEIRPNHELILRLRKSLLDIIFEDVNFVRDLEYSTTTVISKENDTLKIVGDVNKIIKVVTVLMKEIKSNVLLSRYHELNVHLI
jgi:hypothetical protein